MNQQHLSKKALRLTHYMRTNRSGRYIETVVKEAKQVRQQDTNPPYAWAVKTMCNTLAPFSKGWQQCRW